MDEKIFVEAEDVAKKFCKTIKHVLKYGSIDIAKDFLGLRSKTEQLRNGEFFALDGVSFKLNKGETLGLIGANGSGKSTLLRLMNGIFLPDRGRIVTKGKVGALIAVGAGFHKMLTGRENIYVNGQILGMSKKEIDGKLEEIIEFAEIDDFIDAPVKHYSSGMFVRLGFSIATHCEPEILLIDEVLAVGDSAFQAKCMSKIESLLKYCAVILVSHSMYQIEALCNHVLWLEKGKNIKFGKTAEVVNEYLDYQENLAYERLKNSNIKLNTTVFDISRKYVKDKGSKSAISKKESDNYPLNIMKVEISDKNGKVRSEFPFLSDITVKIYYRANEHIKNPLFNIRFGHNGKSVFETSMLIDGPIVEHIERGEGVVECAIEKLPLNPKTYDITIFVRSQLGVTDIAPMNTYARFKISNDGVEKIKTDGPYSMGHLRHSANLVYVPHIWKISSNKGTKHQAEY